MEMTSLSRCLGNVLMTSLHYQNSELRHLDLKWCHVLVIWLRDLNMTWIWRHLDVKYPLGVFWNYFLYWELYCCYQLLHRSYNKKWQKTKIVKVLSWKTAKRMEKPLLFHLNKDNWPYFFLCWNSFYNNQSHFLVSYHKTASRLVSYKL